VRKPHPATLTSVIRLLPLLLLLSCLGPTAVDADLDGWWTDEGDCDDSDPSIFPGAVDLPSNGIDEDCDGVDATELTDADGDGSPAGEDCDDTDRLNAPHLSEYCDGQDNDCDGAVDEGWDDDGDGVTRCGPDFDHGTADDDCDDADPANFPGNVELCDGQDNDCDEVLDEEFDVDGDGTSICGDDGVLGTADDDCDDDDPDVEPGIWDACDGVDVNCNGLVDEDCDPGGGGDLYCYADADGDGWGGSGTVVTADTDCNDPGESGVSGDCQDADPSIHPGALETPGNGVDEDCDGADQVSDCDGPFFSASEGEPNDSAAQTNLLVSADGHVAISGTVSCGAGADDDWFSVSFGCGGPVTFVLDWTGTSSDLDLDVIGTVNVSESGGATNGPVSVTGSASVGSMVVVVSCVSGSPTSYELTVDWD
jgi:hypothetical protein